MGAKFTQRPSPDGRVRDLDVVVAQLDGKQLEPTSLLNDQRLSNESHNSHLGESATIKLGKINYSVPYVNWYRVELDDGGASIGCCLATQQSVTPFSVRGCSPLAPAARVIVALNPGATTGVILGVVPDVVEERRLVYPDWIEQGGGSGFKREEYYNSVMHLTKHNAGIQDWSNCRSIDATSTGEWGFMNDLGMGVFLDQFMGFFRTDESTGMWLYYFDKLMRLAAYNFQHETAGSEVSVRDDEGEILHASGFTPYPWEALGVFDPETDPHRDEDDFAVQYTSPVGRFEPSTDDQQPFFRYEEYRGYCGQGATRQLCLPPAEAKPGGSLLYNRLLNATQPIGVFRENVGLDGSYTLQSAHSIHLQKRIIIPVPKRVRQPEDDTGDNSDVYKHASKNGEGDDHKVTGSPAAGDYLPHLQSVAALSELHAHAYNWKQLHAFHYHQNDYVVPEMTDTSHATTLQVAPSFGDLSSKQHLERPVAKKLHVDHRYGETDYYETTAGVSVLPDGSVVIRDGYGSEISMTGGNVYISAPGDVWRRPGRSCVDWSGDDHIIKANKSIDITTSQKDIRIKAEQNLEMMAGNSGSGRLLLENRAWDVKHDYEGKIGEEIEEASGIILRSNYSQVVCMGKEVYLRTGGAEGGVSSGNIIIDADKGRANIYTHSNIFDRKLGYGARDSFFAGLNSDNPKIKSTNYFGQNAAWVGSGFYVDGSIVNTKGGAYLEGHVYINNGHIASSQSEGKHGLVGAPKKGYSPEVYAVAEKQMAKQRKFAAEAYSRVMKNGVYAKGNIGNDDTQKSCEFSLRNETQYNTLDFALPQSYWQQLAAAGGGGSGWYETVVTHGSEQLMPYPGHEAWTGDSGYLTTTDQLHNSWTGVDADRQDNDDYAEPQLPDWEAKSLNQNYLIIDAKGVADDEPAE